MKTLHLVYRQTFETSGEPCEDGDELIAITTTFEEAKSLLDAPNFDLTIIKVTLDQNGLVVERETVL